MAASSPHGAPAVRSVGGFDRSDRLWVLGLYGIGGVALGVLLPYLAGLARDLPWMPFQGPLELLGAFDEPWLVWGRPVLGLVVGLGLAVWSILETPVLDISQDQVQVRRRGQVERVIERAKVDSVHPRGAMIVIETESGRTLFEGEVEGATSDVRSAFIDAGYPWEGPRD